MNKILDILLPRFITEDVALMDVGDHLVIACALADVKAGEEFPAIATARTFNLFGLALFPKMIGEPRDWPSAPHNTCSECGFMWAYGESAKHSCALYLKATVQRLEAQINDLNGWLEDTEDRLATTSQNASAFEERMGELQVQNGKLRDRLATHPREGRLALLRRVEQMAAYYEAPKGFFDWLDQQVTLHGDTPTTPEPAGFRIEVTPGSTGEDRT